MQMKTEKDSRNIGYAFGIIAVFTSLGMMHGDSTLSTEMERRILSIPNYICSIYILFQLIKTNKFSWKYLPLIASVLIWWFYYSFHSFRGGLASPLLFFILILFSLSDRRIWYYSFKLYKKYIIVVSTLGLIAYIVHILSLPLPHERVPFSATNILAYYINYKFAYILEIGPTLRLCGLFNEPGEFGTLLAVCLISERINLKKKSNVIMLIACALTVSFAAFLLIGMYLIMYSIKNIKTIVSVAVIFLIVSATLSYWAERNAAVGLFMDRVDTSFEESNFGRTSLEFDVLFDNMYDRGYQWFGYGAGYLAGENTHSSGYKPVVLEHGIIGFTIIIGSFIVALLTISKKTRDFYIYFVCILAIIYKAGIPFYANWFVLFLGGIEYIQNKRKEIPIGSNIQKCTNT